METAQIVSCVIYLALSAGSFAISWFQFQEKGFLFNNYYLWASQEERRRMTPEDKRPYYRHSGGAFILIGAFLLLVSAYIATEWAWLLWAFIPSTIAVCVYAFVSSIQLEQRKSEKTKC